MVETSQLSFSFKISNFLLRAATYWGVQIKYTGTYDEQMYEIPYFFYTKRYYKY